MKKLLLLLVVLCGFPSFALADYSVYTNVSTTAIHSIMTGENTNTAQRLSTIGVGTVSRVDVCLYKTDSPTGTVTLSIYASDGTNPTGSALGSASLSASSLPTSAARVEFDFGTPVSVSASTEYQFVLSRSASDSNVVTCGSSGTGTPTQRLSTNNMSTWSGTSDQHNVILYVTEAAPPAAAASVFSYLFGSATSTGSSTLSIVDNPTQDMFNVLVLFTAWFFGVYWVFSKKR